MDDCSPFEYALYSHAWSGMGSYCDYIHGVNLSNLTVALFIACSTGCGGSAANNLPAKAVEAGAKCAIGFESEILCQDANEWACYFFEYLASGHTIGQAANYAKLQFPIDSGLRKVVICGDSTQFLVP